MRSREVALVALILCSILASGEKWSEQGESPNAPQTARQALLEMLFGKSTGTFVKHLPAATLAALEKAGALAGLNQYALLGSRLEAEKKNLQTFETGSVLLASEDPKTATKVEVIVENDALRGDEDDIQLSFQAYTNGAAQRTPFMPRMTFSMKWNRESGSSTKSRLRSACRWPIRTC